MSVPTSTELMDPIINALRSLGDSAGLKELENRVAALLGLRDDVLSEAHVRNRGTDNERITASTEFGYRLRWALTYLKKAGFVTNSTRGVWSFTEIGQKTQSVDSKQVVSSARALGAAEMVDDRDHLDDGDSSDGVVPISWSTELLEILLKLEPAAFERLAQRLLREAGFSDVEVTGRSGDGGIDGRGLLKLNDLISMHAMFQCKRYARNVGPADIREFRGAISGRADRGIFVTTARFTPAALAEAARDGVIPIDLVDGERLMILLKRFELGITIEHVERVVVDRGWFENL